MKRFDREHEVRATESYPASSLSRRTFLQILGAAPMINVVGGASAADAAHGYFTIVNHWHQSGVGWYFREGKVGDRHYQKAFSIFYGMQKTIDAARQFPWLTICLEFDSHAYEVMYEEDPQFVQEKIRPLMAAGRIEPVGGTYTQPYAQLVGWQSNVRQFVEGRAVAREVLGKDVDCFLVEEIIFHPQMPQLLRLCGFPYASLQVQNNGSLPLVKKAVVNWRGLDGTLIPTIPFNPWLISLVKQNQSLARYVDPAGEAQQALLTIWAEIWPPGLDWGASYVPYTQGFQSLREAGLQSLGFSEYMHRRCPPGTNLESQYWKMDEPVFLFGWPQNQGSLWGTMGGWGYEGDALLKQNRRLEHELNAAEMLISLAPDAARSKRLRELWKKLMQPQNHDCFIVSEFPAEYENIRTTNLEVARMMSREVEAGLRELRQEACAQLAVGHASEAATSVLCQNPAGVAVRQVITLEAPAGEGFDYWLECGNERVDLQRVRPVYVNDNPTVVGVADLPPCGFKTYSLKKGPAAPLPALPASQEIANEFYSVTWDESRKGFVIHDRDRNRDVLFRPFSGEVTQVKETWWAAPNSGVNFRAKDFGQVSYTRALDAAGPVLHALAVKGNVLTLSTSEEPPAWVTARTLLYQGLRRVDIVTELNTYPRIAFNALAELELAAEPVTVVRDFPFGEEASLKDQCSALNYLRLQSAGFAVVLAHGGTQQFFPVRTPGHIRVRNMIARGTLKGSYRWHWSVTTGSSFTAAESYRFAEASWGPVIQHGSGAQMPSQSWVAVNDPAVVVFRVSADPDQLLVWMMNYSEEHTQGELTFTVPVRACRRVDLEGNPLSGASAVLDDTTRKLKLNLSPWEIAAVNLVRG